MASVVGRQVRWLSPTNALLAILTVGILFSNVPEAYYRSSFRAYWILICTGVFAAFFLTKQKIRRNALLYLLLISLYLVLFLSAGPANPLIVHVYTMLAQVALLYCVMVVSGRTPENIWAWVKFVWAVIYFTLLTEFILVLAGYQPAFYDTFPERRDGPSYRILHNTFSDFFDLGYLGLNSIILAAQAYGQLCAMLIVFSFQYAGLKKRNFARSIFLLLLPLILLLNSPNLTAMLILVTLVLCNVGVKQYIGLYSARRTVAMVSVAVIAVAAVLITELGFIRTYNLAEYFFDYVTPQLDYFLSRDAMEYVLGFDLNEFMAATPTDEIGLLSYAAATGPLFAFVNLVCLAYLVIRNLRQIKAMVKTERIPKEALDMQIQNLLLIVAMLVSSLHFPMMFDFIAGTLFALNVSFCLFSVYGNSRMLAARTAR